MTTEEFHRKLTAILSADVQGYSRLMGEDEDSTVRTLTAYRALMSALIQKHRGRVVDSPGDNLLAEFESLTDAVHCAVEIQEELRLRNADLPDNRKMHFRIGINLGEIIEEGDRIYGDGVNVAARVECLAEGGGICISGGVYDAIKNKLAMSYEFMGEHNVKNIKEPVRIYRIRVEPEAATAIKKEKKAGLRRWQWAALSAMAIIILGAVAIWYFSPRVEEGPKTIAVLPFVDISPEKDQEYFVDGLTEELINFLAQIPDFTVIARTSAFSFKGTTKKVQEIAKELSVDHILEGSVRKSGDALRITAQLVKGVDGAHLWSKTYDRELKDIFDIQEDIATTVAGELKVALGIDKSIKQLGGTNNEKAYEQYLIAKGQSNEIMADAKSLQKTVDIVITLDPEFALGWALKARIHQGNLRFASGNDIKTELDEGLRAAQKAIDLEPNLPEAYAVLGGQMATRCEWIEAELAYRKAFELGNESALLFGNYIPYLFAVGYLEKANKFLESALLNDPLNQQLSSMYRNSFFYLGNKLRAKEEHERGLSLFGDRFDPSNGWDMRLHFHELSFNDDILNDPFANDEFRKRVKTSEDFLAYMHTLPVSDVNMGSVAYFGDIDLALDSMEYSFNLQPMYTIQELWFPVYREVRKSPRFKELVKKIGLPDYWNEFGWPDICRPLDNGDFECD